MEILVGLFVGMVFFLCTITAYVIGLKHNKKLIQNIVPFTPLEEIVNHFGEKKEEDQKSSAVEEYWNT